MVASTFVVLSVAKFWKTAFTWGSSITDSEKELHYEGVKSAIN